MLSALQSFEYFGYTESYAAWLSLFYLNQLHKNLLESPSVEFGDGSDSQLIENLLASVSQHQRQKNGEQTKNRMRGRVLNGYWCHYPPVGFRYERVSGHGKLLVANEPLASIVREALEGYASERFAHDGGGSEALP